MGDVSKSFVSLLIICSIFFGSSMKYDRPCVLRRDFFEKIFVHIVAYADAGNADAGGGSFLLKLRYVARRRNAVGEQNNVFARGGLGTNRLKRCIQRRVDSGAATGGDTVNQAIHMRNVFRWRPAARSNETPGRT